MRLLSRAWESQAGRKRVKGLWDCDWSPRREKKNLLGKVRCFMGAIKGMLTVGVYVRHVYEDVSIRKAIVIATSDSFRVSESLTHVPGETVYPEAVVVTSRCVLCGHETTSWYSNQETYERINGEQLEGRR